jgi:hypothetical protein
MDIVGIAIRNARLTLSVLVFLIIAGALAYQSVPKEAEPDVAIPIIYVSLAYQGISPEDSERLLLRPVETKLKSLKGLKEMRSAAFQGGGYVLVEFDPSTDLSDALIDVRNKVSDAKRDIPQGAEEPTVNEVNVSEFPVLVVTLSGDVPERVLTARRQEFARQDRGSAGRARRHDPGLARRSRRGDHRSGQTLVLRAQPAADRAGHRCVEQSGRRRQSAGHRRQICDQGSSPDRNA